MRVAVAWAMELVGTVGMIDAAWHHRMALLAVAICVLALGTEMEVRAR